MHKVETNLKIIMVQLLFLIVNLYKMLIESSISKEILYIIPINIILFFHYCIEIYKNIANTSFI